MTDEKRECRHPEHDPEWTPPRYGKRRCLCYDCLYQRDNVLGAAASRMVDVVERGTLAQIQAQAANLDTALWDTGLWVESGAAQALDAEPRPPRPEETTP